jgi:hypothetical protein
MVISLLALMVPLAFIVAVFRVGGGEDVVVVDPSAAIAQARAAAAFPVAAPDGLGSGWRPVSARFATGDAGSTLRIGYLTPEGGAVQLIESSEPLATLTARELGDRIQPTGTAVLGGQEWQSLNVRTDERALVNSTPDRTLIVIGRASVAELQTLANSLD